MPKFKSSELRKLDVKELQNKLTELKVELASLNASRVRGILKKETGKIRFVKRSIARILTIINEKQEKKVS